MISSWLHTEVQPRLLESFHIFIFILFSALALILTHATTGEPPAVAHPRLYDPIRFTTEHRRVLPKATSPYLTTASAQRTAAWLTVTRNRGSITATTGGASGRSWYGLPVTTVRSYSLLLFFYIFFIVIKALAKDTELYSNKNSSSSSKNNNIHECIESNKNKVV